MIIIFGTGRSGTTVFMEALFRNSSLAYLSNYQENFPNYTIINYLRLLFDNKFYRIFGKKQQSNNYSNCERLVFKATEGYPIWDCLFGSNHNFSYGFLSGEKVTPKIKKRVLKYFRLITGKQFKKQFAIKITGPGRLTFLDSIFEDSKYIYLERDFIPTLSSFLKSSFWAKDQSKLRWEGPYTEKELHYFDQIKNDRILSTAFQLKKIISVNKSEIKQLGIELKVIKYEDFVQRPNQIMDEVLKFCDLPYDKECYNYIKNNELSNRNKEPLEYFDQAVLDKINEIDFFFNS